MVVVLAGVVLTTIPAMAQDVGTTTAVNPTSESTAPGGGTVTLRVGSHIVHKERIHTTPTGTVQLLFIDHSTLSIAPNSNILIDEYVYSPASGAGHMVTSVTQGALRLVGGLLSHQGEATVTTPAAAIGIRGGTVTVVHGPNGTRVIDHFGVITIQNGCGTSTMRRSGFVVSIANWNTCPSYPLRVAGAEIDLYLKTMTSQPGQNGGVPGLHTVTVGECGIGAFHGTSSPGGTCPDTPPVFTDNGESTAFQTILQATQLGTIQTAPTRPRILR